MAILVYDIVSASTVHYDIVKHRPCHMMMHQSVRAHPHCNTRPSNTLGGTIWRMMVCGVTSCRVLMHQYLLWFQMVIGRHVGLVSYVLHLGNTAHTHIALPCEPIYTLGLDGVVHIL